MTLRFAYLAVLRLLGWMALLARSDLAKDAEILVRRHQIAVLQRHVRTPRVSWAGPRDPIRFAQPIPSRQRSQLRLLASWRTLLRWHAGIANAAGVTPTTGHRSAEDKSSAASPASTASPHDNQAIENTHVTGPITYPSPTGW